MTDQVERLEPYYHPELGAQMRPCQTLGGYVRFAEYQAILAVDPASETKEGEDCERCGGTGVIDLSNPQLQRFECQDCNGTGEAVEIPMPPDTLIKVGMLADVEGHGTDIPIEGISIALCPRQDPAAEGFPRGYGDLGPKPTAAEATQIEAALLPYAVFSLGRGGWCYGRQVRAVRENGDEHEG